MNEFDGVVKSMRKDGKSVCISVNLKTGQQDAWLDLAENVKPQYIKSGSKCVFRYVEQEEGNPLLTYIKCESNSPYPNTYTTTSNSAFKPYNKFSSADKFEGNSDAMNRMSALKAASLIYSGSGKEKEFKDLVDEIVEFIKGGNWKGEKKFIEKGELSATESEDFI